MPFSEYIELMLNELDKTLEKSRLVIKDLSTSDLSVIEKMHSLISTGNSDRMYCFKKVRFVFILHFRTVKREVILEKYKSLVTLSPDPS